MSDPTMRLAYVTTYDSNDTHSFSGTGWSMREALQHAGAEIVPIGGLIEPPLSFADRVKRRWYRCRGREYRPDRSRRVLVAYGKQVAARLRDMNCDMVFSPGTLAIAHLPTALPIAFWTDATFAGLLNYYPYMTGLAALTIREGNRAEQAALNRAKLAIYSSEWARETAAKHYRVDRAKLRAVPFGANLATERTSAEIEELITRRTAAPVTRLLFVGVDWVRKGGDIAVGTAARLNQDGLPTELHVVGCEPPGPIPPFVFLYGFLSKQRDADRDRLDRLFRDAHFLILPSRAECVAVVFAEAASYGLPIVATAVGGNATAVSEHNGRLLDLESGPEEYAWFIASAIAGNRYPQLCRGSFETYERRLNWRTAGRTVLHLLEQIV